MNVSAVRMLIILPFFVGGLVFVATFAAENNLPLCPIWIAAPILFLIGFLKLLLHELGHYAAGHLAGFRILGFRFGPFNLIRLADGWHFHWMPELGYMSGFVRSAPLSDENLRSRLIFFTAGGALAEVLSGLVALSLFLASPALGWKQAAFPIGLWAVATLCAPLFALSTDGPPMYALLHGGKESEKECDVFRPLQSWVTPLRPADWATDWPSSPLDSYYMYLDRGDIAAATDQMNLAIQKHYRSPRQGSVCLESAYFSARHEDSATEARNWLTRTKTGYPVERFVELRAEAAVLFAEGRLSESAAFAQMGLELVAACPATGWTAMNAALLYDLLDVASRQTPVRESEWRKYGKHAPSTVSRNAF